MIVIGMLVLPFAAFLLVLMLVKIDDDAVWRLGVTGALAAFLLAAAALLGISSDGPDNAWSQWSVSWVPSLGVWIRLKLDGLSFGVVFCVTVVYLAAFLGISTGERKKVRTATLLLSEVGVLGALTSRDLIFFLAMWLLSWLPLVLSVPMEVIGSKDLGRARKDMRRVSIQLSAAAGFFLCAALALAVTYHGQTGDWTFDIDRLIQAGFNGRSSLWIMIFFMVGLGTGAAVFPFHSWLPYAARGLSLPMLAVLMAGVTKAPLYLLVRLSLGVFPKAVALSSPLLVIVAVFGVVHSGLLSWTHRGDLRRLSAYLTSGFHAVALFGFSSLDIRGVTGASFLTASHALAIGGLVLGLIAVESSGKNNERTVFSQVLTRGWLVGSLLAVASLAAVPILSGFVGEILLWSGCFDSYIQHQVYANSYGGAPLILENPKLWTLITLLGSLLLTAAVVHAFYKKFYVGYQREFSNSYSTNGVKKHKTNLQKGFSLTSVTVLLPGFFSICLGLYPGLFLRPMELEAKRLIDVSLENYNRVTKDQPERSRKKGVGRLIGRGKSADLCAESEKVPDCFIISGRLELVKVHVYNSESADWGDGETVFREKVG